MRITDLPAPWRHRLLPASFKGATYHVEQQNRTSGRRTVLHEYPKRDVPYAEDMGRMAIRYHVVGYVVGPEYHEEKNDLISALESEDAGELVDPYVPVNSNVGYGSTPMLFMCERYSVTESRERGGFAAFEMIFVEAGVAGNSILQNDTSEQINRSSDGASGSAESFLNNQPADI